MGARFYPLSPRAGSARSHRLPVDELLFAGIEEADDLCDVMTNRLVFRHCSLSSRQALARPRRSARIRARSLPHLITKGHPSMSNKTIVHVVGTGTIGEPLIGLFTEYQKQWGIDEVTFHKRTPAANDRAMVEHLINRGAQLVADEEARDAFARLGHRVAYTTEEALERATVVVDCTPAGIDNKQKYYERMKGPKGFLAQGSEFGFGKPYARGINDEIQSPNDRFVQVVSCNTHNISVLLKTLASVDGKMSLEAGRFVCMRRANDVSDTKSFIAAPEAGKHDDPEFGTHHARDAYHVFQTLGEKLNLFSSAIKLPTQYMHTLWFDLELRHDTTLEEVKAALRSNPRIATTNKRAVNQIFSFGRDHGYYGRILSQTVIPTSTLTVPNPRRIVGFCYTPQDGNSLLSSIAATLRYLDASKLDERLELLRPYMFREI
jgi:glyceraldehyde-3-phosphate dehydrogenase type II